MKRSGFTLVEICIVLALFVIICTCTITSFNSAQAIVTRLQTLLLKSTLRHAQWKAIGSGIPQTVTFDVAHNSYSYNKQIYLLPKPVSFGAPPQSKGPPANPTAPVVNPVTFIHQQAVCYHTGAVSSGTVYITDNKQSNFALSNAVSYFSYLRLYRYKNGWQRI